MTRLAVLAEGAADWQAFMRAMLARVGLNPWVSSAVVVAFCLIIIIIVFL